MRDWKPEPAREEPSRESTLLPGLALDLRVAVEVCGWQRVTSEPSPQKEKRKGRHRPRKRKAEALNAALETPDRQWLHPNGRYWPQPCAYSQHFQSALAILVQFAPTEFMVAYGRDQNGVCWARIRRRDDTFDTGLIRGASRAHALALAALDAATQRSQAPAAAR